MVFGWLLGSGSGACCARSPKSFSCLRGGDCGREGGNIVEYAAHARNSSAEFVVEEALCRNGWLPAGPTERTVPTYAIGQDVVDNSSDLQGKPLYTSEVLRLSLGDAIHESIMSLYPNGFLVVPRADGFVNSQTIARLWSPFSLVEKCQVKSKQSESQWAIFKLTFFRKEGQDLSFYFATAGSAAEAERDRWVDEMIRVMSNLTLSLFPKFELSVEPLPGRVATSTRIMAGYLLQGGPGDSASLVFCELHAYVGRESRLALYRDEWCEHEVLSITLCDSSIVSTRKGEYCTVFGINDHLFCARTEDERELWLRAVSNIKVKLMFEAPDPTAEDLVVFRSAVHERIESLRPPLPPGGQESVDAFRAAARGGEDPAGAVARTLLAEIPRRPPSGPRGDLYDPAPVHEEDFGFVNLDAPRFGAVASHAAVSLELSVPPRAHATSGPDREELPETIPGTPASRTASLAPNPAPTAVPGPEPATPAAAEGAVRRKLRGLRASPVSMAAAVLSVDAVCCGEVEGL